MSRTPLNLAILGGLMMASVAPAQADDYTAEEFHASGSTATITCSATANSYYLNCPQAADFASYHGIMLKGGGFLPHAGAYAVLPAPTVEPSSTASGSESYCYKVAVADPYQGIQAPTPATCVNGQPLLSRDHHHRVTARGFAYTLLTNGIAPPNAPPGPAWRFSRTIPLYLFYMSHNGSPYELIDVSVEASDRNGEKDRLDVFADISGETRPNGDFGGWPRILPATLTSEGVLQRGNQFGLILAVSPDANAGGYRIRLSKPAPFTGTFQVFHDDTDALQGAIDWLDVGTDAGGSVSLQGKTYLVQKPIFGLDPRYSAPGYTSELYTGTKQAVMWWGGGTGGHLHISTSKPTTHLSLLGAASGTPSVIKTGPDIRGPVLSITTPNTQFQGLPALTDKDHPITILPAEKGDVSIRLANPADASRISVGADILLFTGSFNPSSPINNADYRRNTNATGSTFTELNTITAIDGSGVVSLALPLTKKYWSDGYNAFGFSAMSEPVPRNITLRDITFDTGLNILSQGPAFNVTLDHLSVLRPMPGNGMGTGYKRGLTISNSSWSVGNGMSGWACWNEFDKTSDVTLSHNTVRGYATKFSEGPSQGAKLYFSEGTNNLRVTDNHFIGIQLIVDQGDDLRVENNVFEDALAWIGTQQAQEGQSNWGHVSYASQHNAVMDNNQFTISEAYGPSWVAYLGNFDNQASFQGNSIVYNQSYRPRWMIYAASGTIANNTVTDTRPVVNNDRMTSFVRLEPDVKPNPSSVKNNVFSGRGQYGTEVLPWSPAGTALNLCVTGNVVNGATGDSVYVRPNIPFANQGYNFQSHCTP